MQTRSKKAATRPTKADKPVTDKDQIDRFKEAARQLEADESEAAFDEKLRKILPDKPAVQAPEPSNKATDKR